MPTLGTTLTRQTTLWGPVVCDVLITFEVDSFTRGYPARTNAEPDHCYPGEDDQFEFSFVSAEFDGEPDDAPGPMTAAETAEMCQWFDDNYGRACEEVCDYAADREADRADYEYDRWRDDQMERGR